MKKSAYIVSYLILLFLPSGLFAQIQSLETKNLQLLYLSKAHEYVVPHLARCFENAYRFHCRLFSYTPSEKITVLLEEFGDFANGAASTVPINLVNVGISPFSYTYETMTANERMNMMMNHELVHVITMDKASGSDTFFRSLFFGKVHPLAGNPLSMFYFYLTSPRWSSPRWYQEGIAVFMETWMAGGLGRALGAYDEMVFRTMVRDGSYFYDTVGLESEGTKNDFQVGTNSYLYGTRFMSYLANRYGTENLIKWTSRSHGSKAYFAAQFKKIYAASLEDEWRRWIDWEKQWQQVNLDSIRSHSTTPYRRISQKALGSVSRAYYDSTQRKLYVAVRYPGQVAHIAAIDIDTGAIKRIGDVKGAALFYVTSLTYDPTNKTLFYTTDNNNWRDLNAVDIETGKSKTLIKDARTGNLAFNQADKSIWGVRHFNGISTLVRIPYPYKEWNQIYSFPYGKDIFDIDISPDGSLLTSALAESDGQQRLIKMAIAKLLGGDKSYSVIFDFDISTPANFIFSPDGRYLYGSSYYSGVSNIYRYDFEKNDMNIISNCETGFFRPVPVSEDSLIVFRYEGKGFVPVVISNRPLEQVGAVKFLGNEIPKHQPIVQTWNIGSPASVNIDSLTIYSGRYSTLGNVRLSSAYPIVEGYKDYAAFGVRLNFSDRLLLSGFDMTASYSPNDHLPTDEKIHLQLNFHHWNWKLTAKYNGADFYDLFGPTKSSRKGYSLGVQYKKTLIYDDPRALDFSIDVAGYGNLEKLPEFQNVSTAFDRLLSGNAKLNYQFVQKSLGAVDEEKGVKWQLISNNNYVNSKFFPRVHAGFEYGILLPLNHSSIWWRNSLGYSFGDRDESSANFYFGGFGNNWVDHFTEKRYREYYSFPGVELNAVGGTNYGKTLAEWTLPPIRFRRVGFPTLYLNWARTALFSSIISTNIDSKQLRRVLINFGGQVDFKMVLFANLHSTFSLGYAVALEKDRRSSKEFMFSLKIL